MEAFHFQKKEIQNHIFRVAANVMEITPIALWIERFQTILDPGQMDREYHYRETDRRRLSMPRLIFHHVNGVEKIVIGINRLEFRFSVLDRKNAASLKTA